MNLRDSVHPSHLQRSNRAIAQELVSRFCADAKHLAQLIYVQDVRKVLQPDVILFGISVVTHQNVLLPDKHPLMPVCN